VDAKTVDAKTVIEHQAMVFPCRLRLADPALAQRTKPGNSGAPTWLHVAPAIFRLLPMGCAAPSGSQSILPPTGNRRP
jgi:hypothetical protein